MRIIMIIATVMVAGRAASADDAPPAVVVSSAAWTTTLTVIGGGPEPTPLTLFGELAPTPTTRWSAGARAMMPMIEQPAAVALPYLAVKLPRAFRLELEAAVPIGAGDIGLAATLWFKRS